MLFPALLQGDKSTGAIMDQLSRIRRVIGHFDVVAIIRGGGGDVGLSSFNNYMLAREIAKFPIPVITGIGHATNETVAEMVSYRNAITPTELADFLLQEFHNFSVPVHNAEEKVVRYASQLLTDANTRLLNISRYFRLASLGMLNQRQQVLKGISQHIRMRSAFATTSETERFKREESALRRAAITVTISKRVLVEALEKTYLCSTP